MKKKLIVTTCTSVILGLLTVAVAKVSNASIGISGQLYRQTIDDSDVASFPSWDPLKQECPVSPSDAVKLAIQALREKGIDITFVKVTYVKLARYESDDPKADGKWYYTLNLYLHPRSEDFWEGKDRTTSIEKGERNYATMFVRLDGKVPEIIKGE